MTTGTIDDAQRIAARVAGILYLVTMASANFAEFFANAHIIVSGDSATTAANIVASERLFRLGVASDLFTSAAVIPLIVALYVVLRPVNRNVALLALSWRLVETSVFVASTLYSLDALRFLSGAAYLRGFEAARLQSMAMTSLSAHNAAYNVALVLFGLGSAAFCYLFFTSNYIPRLLAGLGVFASLLVAISSFAFIIFPELADRLIPGCYAPIFIFEVGTGLWLAIKGLAQPRQPMPVA